MTSPLRRWLLRLLGGVERTPLHAADAPSSFHFRTTASRTADQGAAQGARRGPSPAGPAASRVPATARALALAASAGGGAPDRPIGRPDGPPRLRLAIDDGGDWLAVVGPRVVIGHAQTGAADVGLLADLDARHVELELVESFHGGLAWRLVVVGRRAVLVEPPRGGRGARELAPGERAPLEDGARVVLAPKLSFVFQRPDPASASATLTLERGAEADGAPRVLLLAPGPGGRVTVGGTRAAHVPVGGLVHEVTLAAGQAADGAPELHVRCAGGVRLAGTPEAQATPEVQLPLPLAARVDLLVGARLSPPFAIALGPPTA